MVCQRERERKKERDRKRKTERERDREGGKRIDTDRQPETQIV